MSETGFNQAAFFDNKASHLRAKLCSEEVSRQQALAGQ
jgi:hypothetical protein